MTRRACTRPNPFFTELDLRILSELFFDTIDPLYPGQFLKPVYKPGTLPVRRGHGNMLDVVTSYILSLSYGSRFLFGGDVIKDYKGNHSLQKQLAYLSVKLFRNCEYPIVMPKSLACRLGEFMQASLGDRVIILPKWMGVHILGTEDVGGDVVLSADCPKAKTIDYRVDLLGINTAHQLTETNKPYLIATLTAKRITGRLQTEYVSLLSRILALYKKTGHVILYDDSVMTGFSMAIAEEILVQCGIPRERIHKLGIILEKNSGAANTQSLFDLSKGLDVYGEHRLKEATRP